MLRNLICLSIAICFFLKSNAETFTVTSNADNGPGTLREAITKANANGTAAADLIIFNIADASEAGRTITLQTQLPSVSSNITIDGSTQPGSFLGISTAKISLYLDHNPAFLFTYLYILNATHVKIFGIYFRYYNTTTMGVGDHYAIGTKNSNYITVGAPGKGNMFSAVPMGISNWYDNNGSDSIRNVTIQSNVFGLSSDNIAVYRGNLRLTQASEITIGGPSPDEGNIFVGANIFANQSASNTTAFFAHIENNKFGLDWTGANYYYRGGKIDIWGNVTDDTTSIKTWVLNNIMSSNDCGMALTQLYHKALVKGNKLNSNFSGTSCRMIPADISFNACKSVTVGGHTPQEENFFPNAVYSTRKGVHFVKNQFGWIHIAGNQPTDPFAKILTYDNGVITGKSNANAKIQLYTNTCISSPCINRKYLATTFADASGNWTFAYAPGMPNIIATATTPDSSTSEFSEPEVDHSNYVVKKNPTCGRSNGSITGIRIYQGTHIAWLDSYTLDTLSTDTNLVNVPEGSYVLTVSNGANGCKWNANFTLYDQSVPASITPSVTNASCGQNNGSFYVNVFQSLSFRWMNANYDSIGNSNSIWNLPPGFYYLRAWVPTDTSCNKTYGPFEIKNLAGPSLNTAVMQINAATCGSANGSITGITGSNVTGTPSIRWLDSLNNIVGTQYNLLNIPAGKYRMKFKDASSCDTITTTFYVIQSVGVITIDTAGKKVTASKCTGTTGSIQQIRVTGADSYEWTHTGTGAVVGNLPDVFNLAPGSYQLTARNSYGCNTVSPVIVIPQSVFIPIGVTGVMSRAPFCGMNNGIIRITAFNNDSTKYTFRWVDSVSAIVVGAGTGLYNLDKGTYQLFATDSNGCEKKIFTSVLGRSPTPVIDQSQAIIKADQCNARSGSITGLKISGIFGPTTYTWLDQNNNVVGNSIDLHNISAGTYVLHVNDAGFCIFQSNPIQVTNNNAALNSPLYENITISRNSNAVLSDKNQGSGTYLLYANSAGTSLLQQNSNGIFTINNIGTDTAFYIRKVLGTCSTAMVKIQIKVVDRSFFAIPNAFSPNGRQANERLSLKVIGQIDVHYFRIYNRWGQLLFETRRINDGWDGLLRGVPQPEGVYVWVAEGKDIHGKVIRDQGSFVLIR